MSFDLGHLFFGGIIYLLVLFYIAYAAEQGWIPSCIVRHPLVYVLSLGVYATTWSFYGSVGFAHSAGYNFLTIYLGVSLAFFIAPILLAPILQLIREYQLTSLADLFAFRYHSQAAGILVTLFMLVGTLPYISLQIRAITETVHILTQEAPPTVVALGFCLTMMLFAILFGARHITPREKHEGLVIAIAFESLIKLTAIIAASLFALFGVFGSLDGLNEWLTQHPQALENLYRPIEAGNWITFLLLSFSAAFLLPRQFHMTFVENIQPRSLDVASWGLPLYLLLFNLGIPLILWAGQTLAAGDNPDYYVLTITLGEQNNKLLPTLIFFGGMSAASTMIIVTTLALAAMCLNHLVLPARYPGPQINLYRWLLWARRLLIALIILAAYAVYIVLEHNRSLVQLGLISFVAAAQFLPGMIGVLSWSRATRQGFISGLIAGSTVWLLLLVLPLLHSAGLVGLPAELLELLAQVDDHIWQFVTVWSLGLNALLFVSVSLLTLHSPQEWEAAKRCTTGSLTIPAGTVNAASPAQFKQLLMQRMGEKAAHQEVFQAMQELGMDAGERRISRLHQLRDRIERNMYGLVGPILTRMIVSDQLQVAPPSGQGEYMRLLEEQLEYSHSQLRGLAAELDSLRRYHRQILQDLPLGVCAVNAEQMIVNWNLAMNLIVQLPASQVIGLPLSALPSPWDMLIGNFLAQPDNHLYKQQIQVHDRQRWFNLHKATIEDVHVEKQAEGAVILVEDLTGIQMLEAELVHNDRLASIGRLSAGVAHEIGNPLTGIDCLAQNLRSETTDPIIMEYADHILTQTRRIARIVQSLVSFSHAGSIWHGEVKMVDIRLCVQDAIDLVSLSARGKEMDFMNHCAENLQIPGNMQYLQQAFVNLLNNACHASVPGAKIMIESEVYDRQANLFVKDNGSGIAPELIDKVFEPFVTTRQPGEGTGLGLSLVYNIIREHKGQISIESPPGQGTQVHIRLPLELQQGHDPAL